MTISQLTRAESAANRFEVYYDYLFDITAAVHAIVFSNRREGLRRSPFYGFLILLAFPARMRRYYYKQVWDLRRGMQANGSYYNESAGWGGWWGSRKSS